MGPDGETKVAKDKLPCIPLRLPRVIVELALVPAFVVRVEVDDFTLKSWM